MDVDEDYSRLPPHIVPCHYNLLLKPDLDTFQFKGVVEITVEVKKATYIIVVNANKLTVDNLEVFKCCLTESNCSDLNDETLNGAQGKKRSARSDKKRPKRQKADSSEQTEVKADDVDSSMDEGWTVVDTFNEEVAVEKYEVLKPQEVIVIKLTSLLEPCVIKLSISYQGVLDDSLRGFYRTLHTLSAGDQRWGAACHFEATGARKCFPCFDQPEFRSTFDISVARSTTGIEVLSNMGVMGEEEGLVKFHRTPALPSYLVCIILGYYGRLGRRSEKGVPVTVFTPQGQTSQGEYALSIATKAVDYFGEWFDLDYSLPKLDLVAVPDFYIGAMENWGLLTFRETALLFHPSLGTEKARQYVSILVTHEIGHQWFGNLVSLAWWDQLWLKEGFATWISFLAVDHLAPQFDIWSQFLISERLLALNLDCLASSHPIEIPDGVKNPGQIDEIFDEISYSKGASIINMLYHWLGEKLFRKGLSLYLTKFREKSATTEQLWEAIEEASNLPVKRVMSDWTKVQGFPQVSVEITDEGIVRLRQDNVTSGQFWIIPLRLEVQGGLVHDILFEETEMDVELELGPNSPWLLVNKGQTSFCRVSYSPDLLSRLCSDLDSLSVRDRAGLLSDIGHCVWSGKQGVEVVLGAVGHFKGQVDWPVVQVLLGILARLEELFEDTKVWASFLKLVYSILQPSLEKLGWEAKEGDGPGAMLARAALILKLGKLGHNETVGSAWVLWRDEMKGRGEVNKDIKMAVYSVVARTGKVEEIEVLLSKYRESNRGEERRLLGSALANCGVEVQRARVLNWAISDQVKLQDRTFVLEGVAATGSEGREAAWQFFTSNSGPLLKQYTSGQLLKNLVLGVTRLGSSDNEADRFSAWFKEQGVIGVERTLQQAEEEVRARAGIRALALEPASVFFGIQS